MKLFKYCSSLVLLISSLFFHGVALSAPIYVTIEGEAFGGFGDIVASGTSIFDDISFRITFKADNSTIETDRSRNDLLEDISTTIEIAGKGQAKFIDQMRMFSRNGIFGLSRSLSNSTLPGIDVMLFETSGKLTFLSEQEFIFPGRSPFDGRHFGFRHNAPDPLTTSGLIYMQGIRDVVVKSSFTAPSAFDGGNQVQVSEPRYLFCLVIAFLFFSSVRKRLN